MKPGDLRKNSQQEGISLAAYCPLATSRNEFALLEALAADRLMLQILLTKCLTQRRIVATSTPP